MVADTCTLLDYVMKKTKQFVFAIVLLVFVFPGGLYGQAWNTFRRDHARSGQSDIEFNASALEESWKWESPLPPQTAWDGPARWDAFNRIRDLPAMRQYDACFHPVCDGESAIYFGSSSQDSLFALNLKTGTQHWSYVAGGPIRLAPTIDGDRILFGCDDGYVYCLNRQSGKLVWKFNPSRHAGAEQRRLINNGRLISYYPIRTGVTVRDGVAYFGASLLPWRESYICAVDAKSGELSDPATTFVKRHNDATLEGNLLVADSRLIVPQGRVAPLLFDRGNGQNLGSLPGGGGVTIVLTESGEVVRTEGGSAARAGQVGVFHGKERVASFPRGRAIVVSSDNYYVVDGQKLFAASRMNNELRWTRDVDEPLELIKSGEILFVGGRDHVTGVNARNGTVEWSARTDGRVFGLAVAGEYLLAATDTGTLHVFAEGSGRSTPDLRVNPEVSLPDKWTSPPVANVREKNILHRWVFHRSAMTGQDATDVESMEVQAIHVTDQAGSADLQLTGKGEMVRPGKSDHAEALQLDGSYLMVVDEDAGRSPDRSISVEAWVRVDQPQTWGSIVGCLRDDGSIEHGWLLGYRDDKFCFGVAAGGSGITYLTAEQSFTSQSWNHLVGTYNGEEMRLYVNGSLAASSDAETGPISYGDTTYFTVACYRDTDESFPMIGALHEIRIYAAPVPATTVQKLFAAKAEDFGVSPTLENDLQHFVSWGPYSRYVSPGAVEISFGTKSAVPTVVDVIQTDGIRQFSRNEPNKRHRIVIEDLPYRRELQFQIRESTADKSRKSPSYSLDTHFNWTQAQPEIPPKQIARLIDEVPNPRGLVYVIGERHQQTAKMLASTTDLNIVLVVDDAIRAAAHRLSSQNLPYGQRYCVTDTPIGELPGASATIVISSDDTSAVRRLVRPAGGLLFDGESIVWKRGRIGGSGDWSHMYGNIDNSAFGGEHLGGATSLDELVTQWIGRPGPRYQTDRQNRKPSPLAAGGRLYLQGQQRMIGLDSYSGVILWSVETPKVMRWNMPHDCANWCADEQGIFVAAENQAWFIDGRDGQLKRQFDLPISGEQSSGKYWGYIGRHRNLLLGTIVDAKAVYAKWWGPSQWFDSTGGADTHVVAGDELFALDHESGEIKWKYTGLILHPTISVLDDRVYFVQDQNPPHLQSTQRRVSLDEEQLHELVCLDAHTGERLWKSALEPFGGHLSSLYLAGGGDGPYRSLVMVASQATTQTFVVTSFNAKTGMSNWSQTIAWEANHHGKHISRPAIQGDLVYIRPEVLRLADGVSIHRGFPGGHGCSSYTMCANGIFSRLGETTWWDVRSQKVNRFKRIRTDCWISAIPAQGMLLSAEGGGGCSCGNWLEISLAFLPRSIDESSLNDE